MRSYAIPLPEGNLLAPLEYTPTRWTLTRSLAFARGANPKFTTARGVRRRSKHEHQVDEGVAILSALDVQGSYVRVGGRFHIVPRAASFDPFRLLYDPAGDVSAGVRSYRKLLARLIDWAVKNGPASGWALRQSKKRAKREERATAWYLPRRCYAAFYAWRRVVRLIVRLLATLHRWWDSLIPPPRSEASTAKPERTQSGEPARQREKGAQVQGSAWGVRPEKARRVGELIAARELERRAREAITPDRGRDGDAVEGRTSTHGR